MHRNFFKEYFSFSLAARRGIWVLLILIIISFSIPFLYSLLLKNNCKLPDPKEIVEFDKALAAIKDEVNVVSFKPNKAFDPNKISREEWIGMGVKPKTADYIFKYLNKGGRFYKKQDLLKIYGFNKTTYNNLAPFMVFLSDSIKYISKIKSKSEMNQKTGKTRQKSINCTELNKADSIALDKLPYIGKTLSIRIIKYRNSLGGFYKKEQLLEVYGLNINTFDSVKSLISVDTNLITKINLNQVSEKQLSKHPYVGKYKALEIIKYKKFKNKISNYDELVLNGFFSIEEMKKLKYYFKLD
jgi:competence protein ComEA